MTWYLFSTRCTTQSGLLKRNGFFDMIDSIFSLVQIVKSSFIDKKKRFAVATKNIFSDLWHESIDLQFITATHSAHV